MRIQQATRPSKEAVKIDVLLQDNVSWYWTEIVTMNMNGSSPHYFLSGSGTPQAAAQNEFPVSARELCFQVRLSVDVYSPCRQEPLT